MQPQGETNFTNKCVISVFSLILKIMGQRRSMQWNAYLYHYCLLSYGALSGPTN